MTGIGNTAGATGSVIGGVAGQAQGSGDWTQAQGDTANALAQLEAIGKAPDISAAINLQKYGTAGQLTPAQQQAISAGPSAASNATTNPAFTAAQMNALQSLSQRAQGGLNASDRAAMNEANLSAQGNTQSKIAQIQQQAAAQGTAGAGSTLAAKLAAAQGGANTQAQQDDALATAATNQALQAAAQQGSQATQMQGQAYNQQLAKAQAQDQMSRFNTQNQQQVNAANTQSTNQAQYANLANAQQAANANTSAANNESYNQDQRQMQQYAANLGTAEAKAGAYNNAASALTNYGNTAAQNTYNTWAGAGQALGGAASAAGKSSGGSGDENSDSSFAHGGMVHSFKAGGPVPGQAAVPGDSPRNDTVHAMVSPGEIVVPRSLADSKLGRELVKLIKAHNSVKNKLNGQD